MFTLAFSQLPKHPQICSQLAKNAYHNPLAYIEGFHIRQRILVRKAQMEQIIPGTHTLKVRSRLAILQRNWNNKVAALSSLVMSWPVTLQANICVLV